MKHIQTLYHPRNEYVPKRQHVAHTAFDIAVGTLAIVGFIALFTI